MMNFVLSTRVDETHDKHPPSSTGGTARTRRVTIADRVALHLGLALITWSRRSGAVNSEPTRDQLRARHAHARDRADRELRTERALRLTMPTR
jgi:hypothetical protein